MKNIDPSGISNLEVHKILLGGVAPRPIAFASTIDKNGIVNLSPFSFYNAFGVNPTTLIFSPSRRGRDNTTKHTLENVKEVPEVVLNAVTYDMVQQMSLSSTEYPAEVDEFVKSGLTAIDSLKVQPPRVKESPLHFECIVREVIETGGQAGSANLVVCEIVHIHVDEKILDKQGLIDTNKIQLVGRMGGNGYVKAFGDALFDVPKPLATLGIGVDSLPESIRNSQVLTGNDLGQLGNLERLPTEEEIRSYAADANIEDFMIDEYLLHKHARVLLEAGRPFDAMKALLASERLGQ
jgi:flavin reductase (DIM6/NTAB) family NADH-FMN oxidoreductase RutF